MGDRAVPVQWVEDDNLWRRELCPDCGLRLIGLSAWKDHGRRHRWGPDWFAVRLRAARPGELITFSPDVFQDSGVAQAGTVEDDSWRAGIPE